ncbi:MAG: hypothetical protein HYV63_16230 [Candidatus Schekmanbacteria bacterium]|nr:hypothetical protein [Candidatus Schekmanbacteria bacterium]
MSATAHLPLWSVGGKSAGLLALQRAGILIPETWVIPADSVCWRLSLRRRAEILRRFWCDFTAAHPEAQLAVRSSAAGEDSPGASHAGIFASVIGVDGETALLEAVLACRESALSERARAYATAHGEAPPESIAVILQRLIPAEVAGVLMTANPLRPWSKEIVIEAAPGLGEKLVSGAVAPSRHTIGLFTGELRDHPGARSAGSCLNEEQLWAIWRLALRVEATVGPAQDIEWAFCDARLYALQLRPMTAIPSPAPANVWSRRFGDEYLADCASPMSHSLLGNWIEDELLCDFARRFGVAHLLADPPLRLHRGYAYVSGEYVARMLSALPVSLRRAASMSWFDDTGMQHIRDEPFRPWVLLSALAKTSSEALAWPLANLRAAEAHFVDLGRRFRGDPERRYRGLDRDARREALSAVMAAGRRHFQIIRWGMGLHAPMLYAILRGTLARWAADPSGELFLSVLGERQRTLTGAVNREIRELADLARADPELRARLSATRLTLADRQQRSPFWQAFDGFLERHGHRSPSRDLNVPTWRERPELVLGLVEAQARGVAEGARPVPGTPAAAAGDQALAEVVRRVRQGRLGAAGAARSAVITSIVDLARRFTRYREDQRYYLDMILSHVRALVLLAGRDLAVAGTLQDAELVFFLTRSELERARAGSRHRDSLQALATERRLRYLRDSATRPATYLYDDVETEGRDEQRGLDGAPDRHGAREAVSAQELLTGSAASPGCCRGRVRVIRSVADLESVRAGEVLVASALDPAWTAVFGIVSGVITETGGMLSHAALIAREQGIPAVCGVARATDVLVSGEIVEVDANGAVVRRCRRA